MTWLDAALVILVMAVAALITERRWAGVVMAGAGLLLLGPLLRLSSVSPLLALLVAVAAGLLLAVMCAKLIRNQQDALPGLLAGGVTGLAFAAALLLAIVTSLPVELNPDNTVSYPPQNLPPALHSAVNSSPLFRYGRTVTLQPLLGPAAEQPLTEFLHDWFIPVDPWLVN